MWTRPVRCPRHGAAGSRLGRSGDAAAEPTGAASSHRQRQVSSASAGTSQGTTFSILTAVTLNSAVLVTGS
jgi:hypothetical protein